MQLEVATRVLEAEGDRALDAVEDLLVGVAVGRVAVAGAVRPRIAAARLLLELPDQILALHRLTIDSGQMDRIRLRSQRREEMLEVTDRVRACVAHSAVHEGLCLVSTPHTTCGVTTNEGYDPDVMRDAVHHMRELVPHEAGYQHAEGNSDSHIKAMLVGSSCTLPVSGGELKLGRWQAIFLCEFDGPRDREIWVTVK